MRHEGPFFLFKSEKKTDEGQLKQMRQVPENLFFFFFWPKYTKFEQNIPCVTRVLNIFTKRAQSARMILDEASSPFCIPVAGQC